MTRAAVSRPPTWVAYPLLLCLLGAGAVAMGVAVDRSRPALTRAQELSYLPQGRYLKVAVLGYRQLAADLLWLKAVQQFGVRNQSTEGYLWAYHAVDVLTDLDPKFAYAYQATGSTLGVWANLPRESVAILEKGFKENPSVWQLPFYLGYDYYYELHDPATAAKYLRLASELPGAPDYLPRLAARMTVEAGDPEAALEFLQRLYQQVQDERLKEGLAARIKEVVAERDIAFLEEGVRRYRQQFSRLPRDLDALVQRQIIESVPPEPFGGRYQLTAEGRVVSPNLRDRLRVYRH